MRLFEDIFKSVKRRVRSGYAPGKNPRSHERRGGSSFKSTASMVDAHSADAPPLLRQAAAAFRKGGAVAAGRHLDKRALSETEHRAKMADILATPSPVHGITLAEALAKSRTLPLTIDSMTPARRAQNAKTVRAGMRYEKYRLEKKLGTKMRETKEAHFIMGLPGAGKSKLADNIQKQIGGLLVDSDEFKKHIKTEFRGGLGADAVHAESAHIGDAVQRALMKRGTNMVIPLVGKTQSSMERKIRDLKKNGYKVTVHHVDVPAKFAEERVAQRYVSTGRAVPPGLARAAGDKQATRKTFDAIRSQVDGWGAYSAHNIPGRRIGYAVLGTKGYKLFREK